GDDAGMAGHATASGENAGGSLHAFDIGRAGFVDDKNAVLAAGAQTRRVLGIEGNDAARSTRRDTEASGDWGRILRRLEARMEQLGQAIGIDASDGVVRAPHLAVDAV